MTSIIRTARDEDREPVVELAARAWERVFASVNASLGPDLARRLHGDDWRIYHAAEVRQILASEATETWVADNGAQIIGFVAARILDPRRRIGELSIVGVAPA